MKFAISLILSLAIGGALLAYAVSDLELGPIVDFFANVDPTRLGLTILAYTLLFSVVHALRLWRWSFLLNTTGQIPAAAVWRAGAVGFAAIILLPLRLGELVRPYVISRETSCSFPAALGTVVVERVLDGLVITLLLFLTLATYQGGANTGFALGVGLASLSVFVSALAVALAALWKREWTVRWVRVAVSLVSGRLADRLTSLLETFLDGLQALRRSGSLLPFLGLTIAYWTVNGLAIALLARVGFGLAVGPWDAMTLLAILVVGIMVPGGPGLTGNYEVFTMEGLRLFESPEHVAAAGAAFVATMHLAQFVVQVAPGLWVQWAGAMRGRYSMLRLAAEADRAEGPADRS